MNSLFEDRQKVAELANDKKLVQLESQKIDDKARIEKLELSQKNDQINNWINQNPFEYVEECENYANLVASSGGIMATKLIKLVKELSIKPSKIVQENQLFVATIRNIIWEKYLKIL